MLRFIQFLPPSISFDIFDTLIRQILTYWNNVWGCRTAIYVIYNVFLDSARYTLSVKAITYDAIVCDECGSYPLSIFCLINVLCYLHRLFTMPGDKIIKSAFHTLNAMHGEGFSTRVTKAYDLAQAYDIDMNACLAVTAKQFKSLCSERTKYVFVDT